MVKTRCILFLFFILVNPSLNEEIIDSLCTQETSGASGKCKLLTKQPGDVSKQKCKEYSSYAYEEGSDGVKKYECEHKITKRVVGGEPARRKEFPHMAALGFHNAFEEKIQWQCGGSIISEQYILTVAHCVTNKIAGPPKLVRVGVTSLNDTDHRQDINISQIIPHPDYRPNVYYNDIALIKLEKPIEMNAYARPACLNLNKQISVGQAVATGWGRTNESSYKISNDLNKVTLDIVGHESCNASYARGIGKYLENGIVDDIQLCAGSSSEHKDTCQGDAGGPLQIYHDGDEDIKCMYDIIGLTSFGKGCGHDPSVYTRISHFVGWIENVVWAQLV